MHPESFLARAWTRQAAESSFAFTSSSSSCSTAFAALSSAHEMPPPYDDALLSSAAAATPLSDAPSAPAAPIDVSHLSPPRPHPHPHPRMSPPVPLSTRRNAASPPKPLSTPPPYCASPPLVPVESRGPSPCGSGSEEEDKAPSAAPDEYLSLATPAQRSYFVTLSGLFEGAALGKGPGRDGDEDEEGALAEKGGRRRRGASGEEAERQRQGCFTSCCVVS